MKNYYVILILLFAPSIEAQWSNDPNNNLIVGYGLNPELCSDSAGGCYITYEVGYPSELYLHRIDRYGYQPWGDKRIISGILEEQRSAKIIADGEGGVIVSYGDHILHNTYRLRLQKIDSSGNFLWGTTGIRVSVLDTSQSVQRIVSDGDGGCVIVWMESNIGFAEYRINRIDRNGQRVWSDSGLYIQNDYNFDKPRLIRASDGNYYLQIRENIYRIKQNGEFTLWESAVGWGLIVATPDGGVIIHGYIIFLYQLNHYFNLIAQRKDTLGNNLWQEPYVEIADSVNINSRPEIKYSNGYYYYGWYGIKNGIEKVTQFQALRLDGNKLFPDGSIQIGSPPINGSHIVPLEENRTAFIYGNTDLLPDTLLAQNYDTLGNKLWDENGVVISHPKITYKSYTTDGNGGFIVGGIIDNFTVVAQQVSKYGQLGEVITDVNIEDNIIIPTETILYQNHPNPFNSTTTIKYKLKQEGRVVINLYNILGEKVQTLYKGEQGRGEHQISITLNELPSGVYFFTLETAEVIQVKKLTILK